MKTAQRPRQARNRISREIATIFQPAERELLAAINEVRGALGKREFASLADCRAAID